MATLREPCGVNADLVAALQAIVTADTNYQHAAFINSDLIACETADEQRRAAILQARAALAKAGV